MKKILLLVLAIMLVLSFPLTAFAQITKDEYYARSSLEGNEREFYDHVYSEIEEGEEIVYPDEYGLSDDKGLKIVHYVRNDSPELIRRDGIYTDEGAETAFEKADAKAEEIINSIITDDMTDYKKVEAVYYWIAENTKYGKSSEAGDSGRTIVGALVYGKATCGGLGSTLQYLLYKIDIPCYRVTGGSHAWNIIQIDGEWYNTDISSDQMIIKNGVSGLDWFLWDDSFYDDHERPDSHENPELPACMNDKYMVEPEPTQTPTPEPTATATPAPIVADVEPQEPPGGTGDGRGWLAMMIPAVIIIVVVAVRGRKEKRT